MKARNCSLPTLVFLTVSFASQACAQAMSEEERGALQSEIALVDSEIQAATVEDRKYAGGLIKTLIESRLAILRETKAMLEQRAAAGTFAIALTYTVDGQTFKPPENAEEEVASIDSELAALNEKIARQQADADRYSGGLVQAMKLSAIATMEQTRSMIEQRRLALKYGLPQFIGFAQEGSGAIESSDTSPDVAEKKESPWEIVEVDSKVTESNDSWWKYAWKLTLKNKSEQPQVCNALVEFQDEDGFIIDTDTGRGLAVPASSAEVFTGYVLIDASAAPNVKKVGVKLTSR